MLVVLPDELAVLRDMQPLDREVFYYLAERMDIDSGVIGSSVKVSYGGMALDLSERNGERRRKETLRVVTMCGARESVRRLVAAGLLQAAKTNEQDKQLVVRRVFWAAFLGLGYCDQKTDPSKTPEQLSVYKCVFDRIFNNLYVKNKSSPQLNSEPVPRTLNNNINNNTPALIDEFSMFVNWEPCDTLAALLGRCGVRMDQLDPSWLGLFVSYWLSVPERRYSQAGWTQKLVAYLVGNIRQGVAGKPSSERPVKAKNYEHVPERFRVPRDDVELVAWSRKWGYGDARVGEDYRALRNRLRSVCQVQYDDWKRGLS